MPLNLVQRFLEKGLNDMALAWLDHAGFVRETAGVWPRYGFRTVHSGQRIDEDVSALVGLFPITERDQPVFLPMIEYKEGFYMEMALNPSQDGVLLIVKDVSEMGRAQEEIVQSRHQLALANAALEMVVDDHAHALEGLRRFHMIFEHEVRNATQNIFASLELYRRQQPSEDPHFKSALTSASALTATINAALNVERALPSRGKKLLVPAEIVRNLVLEFRPLAQIKDLELKAQTEAGTDEPVAMDPFRLRLVLINLLGNAIKYTKEGSVILAVERSRSERITFSVCDSGPGIEKELIDSLDSTGLLKDDPDRTKGAGLGLYICRHLTRSMQGRLSIESDRTSGSRVRLDFRL